ncbi:MAG TPA: hypothetical protein VKT82_28935 [Ktedonobacterales bacterium]|nr:hypothetical protein [Ktedonobacterales bacterium]
MPRIAIRMEGANIAEVRGRGSRENPSDQNLDEYIAGTDIVERKIAEFPDGKAYQKKVTDMKRLTEIDHKMQLHTPLDASELVFLYEIDSPIQGFGYSRDPRIKELRSQRNPEEDMPIVFACEPSQIARSPSEIKPGVRAYVGPLVPGIFTRLTEATVEHIYTSFPERKIQIQQFEIGKKNKKQLEDALNQAGGFVSSQAKVYIDLDFHYFPFLQRNVVHTVEAKFQDLGIDDWTLLMDAGEAVDRLGLELCPIEVALQYSLKFSNRPVNDIVAIPVKHNASKLRPIYSVQRESEGVSLSAYWPKYFHLMNASDKVVFLLSKK